MPSRYVLTQYPFEAMHRIQYCLRSLLFVITVISVALAIWTARHDDYHQRLAAVAILDDGTGNIGFQDAGSDRDAAHDFYSSAGPLRREDVIVCVSCNLVDDDHATADERLSAIMRLPTLRYLGISDDDSYGGRSARNVDAALAQIATLPLIDELNLWGSSVSDVGVGYLRSLSRLRVLDLSNTNISDAALKHLSEMPSIEELSLDDVAGISDKGARHLEALGWLRVLRIRDTSISDAGVRYLPRTLEQLDLSGTKVTDRAAEYLAEMALLEHLSLGGCDIGDESMPYLSSLECLKFLDLMGTRVADDGLAAISAAGSLEEISLSGCKRISDAGLTHLRAPRSLQRVSLNGASRLTAAGVMELRRRRPSLRVDWSEPRSLPTPAKNAGSLP